MLVFLLSSCSNEENRIPIPMTEQFQPKLSAYNIYQGDPKELIPSDDYTLFELKSSLFSNYAEKQRLVKVPAGEQIIYNGNGIPTFPEGSILVKTFFYYNDARDVNLGKKVIETRLFIKADGLWNVAAYVWNDTQTDATLELDGLDKSVSWINKSGNNRSIMYHVPDQNECVSCHQTNKQVLPLGPSMRNLNIDVTFNNQTINQLQHLQSLEIIHPFDESQVSQIVDYYDTNAPLSARGRAYLDMNCAHCHNPSGWSRPAREGYDFRYETAVNDTKILNDKEKIKEVIQSGEMPFLGTTVVDQEGLDLIIAYINSL
jgi:uncharacterized repeat protein (TIGR03806 family)